MASRHRSSKAFRISAGVRRCRMTFQVAKAVAGVVTSYPASEFVAVTIHWAGGYESQHEIIRPVGTYAQLRNFEPLMDRIAELREAGFIAPAIADKLNAEGFYPPKRRGAFTAPVVHQLLKRRGLMGNERSHDELRGQHEWWLTDLARELKMSHMKLRDWANRDDTPLVK